MDSIDKHTNGNKPRGFGPNQPPSVWRSMTGDYSDGGAGHQDVQQSGPSGYDWSRGKKGKQPNDRKFQIPQPPYSPNTYLSQSQSQRQRQQTTQYAEVQRTGSVPPEVQAPNTHRRTNTNASQRAEPYLPKPLSEYAKVRLPNQRTFQTDGIPPEALGPHHPYHVVQRREQGNTELPKEDTVLRTEQTPITRPSSTTSRKTAIANGSRPERNDTPRPRSGEISFDHNGRIKFTQSTAATNAAHRSVHSDGTRRTDFTFPTQVPADARTPRALPTFSLRRPSELGETVLNQDTTFTHTPQTLAAAIKRGELENPADERMLHRKYDTPKKLNLYPQLGTVRLTEGKYFSYPAESNSVPPAPKRKQESTQHVSSGLGVFGFAPDPDWFPVTQQGLYTPSVEELCDDIPITNLCKLVSASTAGVIKITDIPFSSTRQEIIAFLGPSAQILRQPESSPYHAVHILLERESGKTGDAFVELSTTEEAAYVVSLFEQRTKSGHTPKIGKRYVQVRYSSQDELLAELFPRAKHVMWENGDPIVDRSRKEYYPGKQAAGFQGFISSEEFSHAIKWATLTERGPFAAKNPTRAYEDMISILHKYPWYAIKHVTVGERDRIYNTTLKLMGNFIAEMRRIEKDQGAGQFGPQDPNPTLLQEFVTAALVCPGFSEVQKSRIVGYLRQDNLHHVAQGTNTNVQFGGRHELAAHWPFVAISVTPGFDVEFVKYYSFLFHEATRPPGSSSLPVRPMGDFRMTYNGSPDPKSLTLAQAARIEYAKLRELINIVTDLDPTLFYNYIASNNPVANPIAPPTQAAYTMSMAIVAAQNPIQHNVQSTPAAPPTAPLPRVPLTLAQAVASAQRRNETNSQRYASGPGIGGSVSARESGTTPGGSGSVSTHIRVDPHSAVHSPTNGDVNDVVNEVNRARPARRTFKFVF